MKIANRSRSREPKQSGFLMIELMLSMGILSVGLGGLLIMLAAAMYTNNRSGADSASTMIAEHVLEQITAQGSQATGSLPITDCAGNTWNIATQRATYGAGNSGANGGNGATLTASGVIDWTQAYAKVPNDGSGNLYAIQYVACGANGSQTTYDVRWNIMWLPGSNNDRLTVIGARPLNSQQVGGLRFVIPANLRTVD